MKKVFLEATHVSNIPSLSFTVSSLSDYLRIVIRSSRASETSNVNHDSRHSAISFESASYFGLLRYR